MELNTGTLNRSGIFTFAVDVFILNEFLDGSPVRFSETSPNRILGCTIYDLERYRPKFWKAILANLTEYSFWYLFRLL
jgi:hypothetical protein